MSANDLRRCKAIDAIEEAWEASNDTFCLHDICIDGFTAGFLLQKWEALCQQRMTYGISLKTINKVVLDRCVLKGIPALQIMIVFLNKIGQELKQLSITGAHCPEDPLCNDIQPLAALLCGLRFVWLLECLSLERVNLRGEVIGYQMRCLLAKNANLEVLQLFGCTVDAPCYDQLMIAIKYHYGLRYLDMGALRLTDLQLEQLVDALVSSAFYKNLQFLDVSGSQFGEKALSSLARLLNECHVLEELILCSCDYLFDTAWPESPYFEDLIVAINSTVHLKSIRLSHTKVWTPLFRALETETAVHIVHDMRGSFFTNPTVVVRSTPIITDSTNGRELFFTECIKGLAFPFSLCTG